VAFFYKFRFRTDDEESRRLCFDPTYELPTGERARSILDWERKQIETYALKNNLCIKHMRHVPDEYAAVEAGKPEWYRDTPTVREFQAWKLLHTGKGQDPRVKGDMYIDIIDVSSKSFLFQVDAQNSFHNRNYNLQVH